MATWRNLAIGARRLTQGQHRFRPSAQSQRCPATAHPAQTHEPNFEQLCRSPAARACTVFESNWPDAPSRDVEEGPEFMETRASRTGALTSPFCGARPRQWCAISNRRDGLARLSLEEASIKNSVTPLAPINADHRPASAEAAPGTDLFPGPAFANEVSTEEKLRWTSSA